MIQSKLFHLAAYSIAGAAAMYDLTSGDATLSASLLSGVQCFAIASIFDRVVRYALARNAEAQPAHICTTVFTPILEECVYSGVLLTNSPIWMIPRLFAAVFTGTTAARTFTGRVTPEQNKQGFTLDTKIGILWALSRELVLRTLSPALSSPMLLLADSSVFALAEVCPPRDAPELPKFGREWSYKVLSSGVFRIVANTAAKTHGLAASITQHLLFNIAQDIECRTAKKLA